MKPTTRRTVVKGLAFATAFAIIPSVSRAARTYRIAHSHPQRSNTQKALMAMADAVKERTGGEVSFQLFPAGMLGSSTSQVDGVRGGTIDIALTGNAWPSSILPELGVLDLPFMFRDRDHVNAVIDGKAGDTVRALFEKHDLVSPMTFDVGFRQITNSVRPIRTAADMKGLKMRVPSAPVPIKTFELLGAVPTPISMTEVFSALETGTVDGQENPINLILETGMHEVQKHLSLSNHQYTVFHMVMNGNSYRSLSKEHADILREEAMKASQQQRADNAADDDKGLPTFREAGVEVVEDVDRDSFRALVDEPLAEDFAKQHGRELVELIRSA